MQIDLTNKKYTIESGILTIEDEKPERKLWEPYWKQVIADGRYLVQRWDGSMRVQEFYHENEASTLKEWAKNVIAYMSLPKPYNSEETK